MTKAILFDLGDTLFGLNPMPDVTEAFATFLAAEGIEDAETEAVRTLESLRERMMAGYASGQLEEPSIAELAQPFIGSGDFAVRAARRLDDLLGEADVARWEARDRAMVLRTVRESGLRIGFVSNTLTSPGVMRRRLAEFGLLEFADLAVFSVEQGVRKPNPAIYRAALDQLGVAAEEVVFVGDRVREDVRGPQALGMRSVLTHEFRQEDPVDSNPLGVIAALGDLLEFLD